MQKTFRNFSVQDGRIVPNYEGVNPIPKLPPGTYTLHLNSNTGQFWFQPLNLTSDGILDLPSPEYSRITKEMAFFLKPETKTKFDKLNYIYKRSCLLHGAPGTGKTIIVNRIVRDITEQGGVCLWVDDPRLLKHAFSILEDTQPETLTGVIFEELDEIVDGHESMLLTFLDGQVQKHNVVYLATTNYLGAIPKRLYRPGRFSSVIQVGVPIAEARRLYLASKLGEEFEHLNAWTEITNGLTIDELKEVVQAVYILENSMEETLLRLAQTRAITEREDEEAKDNDSESDDEDNYTVSASPSF